MLREAEVDDAAAIQKLNATEMGYNYTLTATRQALASILGSPRQHFIQVFDDPVTKEALAYIHAQVMERTFSDPVFNVSALVVSHAYNTADLAQKLLVPLEKLGRRRNIRIIRLDFALPRDSELRDFLAQKHFEPGEDGFLHLEF